MKTVGQLLHAERNRKNVSIEELSRSTKIDEKYISALESDRYDLLPSETFAKGFIRNISLSLGVNPEEYIAVFRRDFRHPEIKKHTLKRPLPKINFPFPSTQILPIVLGILVFLIYLVFQFRAIITPPPLTINKPSAGAVLASPVTIIGSTSTDSLVTVNTDNVVKPDQNGAFQINLSLPVGETTLNIKSTNRFGRTQSTQIPITIISN